MWWADRSYWRRYGCCWSFFCLLVCARTIRFSSFRIWLWRLVVNCSCRWKNWHGQWSFKQGDYRARFPSSEYKIEFRSNFQIFLLLRLLTSLRYNIFLRHSLSQRLTSPISTIQRWLLEKFRFSTSCWSSPLLPSWSSMGCRLSGRY